MKAPLLQEHIIRTIIWHYFAACSPWGVEWKIIFFKERLSVLPAE